MRNKSKWTQTTDNNTLSHIHPLLTIKEKFKIPLRCVIEEEIKELGEKLFCDLSSRNWSTRELSWSIWITKDPSSLIYPTYLSPPSSYYLLASRKLVFSSFPKSHNSARLHLPNLMNGSFQCFLAAPKSHLTLKLGVVSVWAINFSRI